MADTPTYSANKYSPKALFEPYEHYRRIRDAGPVLRLSHHRTYAFGRYSDVKTARGEDSTFLSGNGVGLNPVANKLSKGTTLNSDGAIHTRSTHRSPPPKSDCRGNIHRMSDNTATTATSTQHVVLMMDHGQFYLRGGLGDGENEYPLLEQALAAQPNSGDGHTMVVISPHQNNFEMPITVEQFDTRPPTDDIDWQQVCEDRLKIGPDGVLQVDSTPMDAVDCALEPGRYLVQVSGRGFVNYGWPGGTTPGDVWRIRLWPDDGSAPRAAVRWDMPGFGVPDDAPAPMPTPPSTPLYSYPDAVQRRDDDPHEAAMDTLHHASHKRRKCLHLARRVASYVSAVAGVRGLLQLHSHHRPRARVFVIIERLTSWPGRKTRS